MLHQHSHDHAHSGHDHTTTISKYNQAFVVGLILNGGFVLTEFGLGWWANSVSLMADAGHNLSDVLGLLLAWIASLLANRKPSARFTYGWRKSSILAAFLNAALLLLATGAIVWEAMERLVDPSEVAGGMIIVVAAIGIVVNVGTALMFLSARQEDLNIRAAFQHMVADAMVSLGVVLGGIAILVTDWWWIDPLFSLIISILIVWGTKGILIDSFSLIIDGVPSNIDQEAVLGYLAGCKGVTLVHDLHIWSMSTVETALSAHLIIPGGHPGDEFLATVAKELNYQFGIQHSTLQIERGDSDHPCLVEL